jgi:hypothetical protein
MEQLYSYTRNLLVKDGKVKKDKIEELDIKNKKGRFTMSELGKKPQEVRISKKEFQSFIEKENGRYHVDTNMFKEAVEKINQLLPDVLFRIVPSFPEELPVERGDNGTRPRLKNQLAKEEPRKRYPKSVCIEGLRYFGVGDNEEEKRNKVRYVYEKRMDEIHPSKCNTIECINRRKELNKKYFDYMEETNDCY